MNKGKRAVTLHINDVRAEWLLLKTTSFHRRSCLQTRNNASGLRTRVGLSTRTKQEPLLPSGESCLGPCSTDENTFPSNFFISWSAQSTIYRQHKLGHFSRSATFQAPGWVILFRRHIPQIASNAARSLATGPCTPTACLCSRQARELE